MNPTFYRITVCQIITLFGNAALRFALPLYLLRRIDSAALYGSVTALALVPMLLGTLAGGVLADRCRKQKIMALLDTVSAIGMAAAAVILPTAPVTPLVLAALCLLYAVEGLYQPAVQTSLPLLLNGAALARGNAVIQLVDTIDELLGPLLGSVLLHTLELRGLLLLFLSALPYPPSGSVHCQFRMRPPHVHACVCRPKHFSSGQSRCSGWPRCWPCSIWLSYPRLLSVCRCWSSAIMPFPTPLWPSPSLP